MLMKPASVRSQSSISSAVRRTTSSGPGAPAGVVEPEVPSKDAVRPDFAGIAGIVCIAGITVESPGRSVFARST